MSRNCGGPRYGSADQERTRAFHRRRRIDRAISRVFRSATQPEAAEVFGRLLSRVRAVSDLLHHSKSRGRGQPQVEALRNLAEFAPCYVRPIEEWSGARGSVWEVVASLAQHLLARYPVPRFLCSAWYGGCSGYERRRRMWFIRHAHGAPFRDLDVPLWMTRRIEHHFLASPHHLSIEHALRRAELLSLGASPELAHAVCATRLGEDFSHGTFWRTVGEFFVRVSKQLELPQVGPIVDFLHAVRHEVLRSDDGERIAPAHPNFSVRGRSLASMLRMVRRWHEYLGMAATARFSWTPSRQRPMVVQTRVTEEHPVVWQIVELIDSTALHVEGRLLQHCVASYASRCYQGASRIWSVRRRHKEVVRSIATVEVNPRVGRIVQARGLRNRPVSGIALHWITTWARRENLRLAL